MSASTFKLAVITLLVTLSYSYAAPLMCKDMDAAACKMEFMKHLDMEVKMKHMELMKTTMTKLREVFDAVMKEMPADDAHTKMMSNSVNEMEKDLETMNTMMDMTDTEKMGEMMEHYMSDMMPNFSTIEDKTNKEMFAKMLEKYNFDRDLLHKDIMALLREIRKIWDELYGGLREMDKEEYPMYNEINEMMQTTKSMTDINKKTAMAVMIIKKMMDFQRMPYMMVIMNMVCPDCDTKA